MIAGHGSIARLDGPDGKPWSGGGRVSATTAIVPARADRRAAGQEHGARHHLVPAEGAGPSRGTGLTRYVGPYDDLAAALARLARVGTAPGAAVLTLQHAETPGDSGAAHALVPGSVALAYRRQGALPALYPQTPAVFRVRV
jgi:hypothetical protein